MRNAEILRRLREAGFTVDGEGRGIHLKVRQNGKLVAVLSRGAGSGEPRMHKNLFSQIRKRTGIDLRHN